jgi:hypothetical protein
LNFLGIGGETGWGVIGESIEKFLEAMCGAIDYNFKRLENERNSRERKLHEIIEKELEVERMALALAISKDPLAGNKSKINDVKDKINENIDKDVVSDENNQDLSPQKKLKKDKKKKDKKKER